jgi:hypothetical protein
VLRQCVALPDKLCNYSPLINFSHCILDPRQVLEQASAVIRQANLDPNAFCVIRNQVCLELEIEIDKLELEQETFVHFLPFCARFVLAFAPCRQLFAHLLVFSPLTVIERLYDTPDSNP